MYSIIVWNDGTYKILKSNESWEFEKDLDWLVTIKLSDLEVKVEP